MVIYQNVEVAFPNTSNAAQSIDFCLFVCFSYSTRPTLFNNNIIIITFICLLSDNIKVIIFDRSSDVHHRFVSAENSRGRHGNQLTGGLRDVTRRRGRPQPSNHYHRSTTTANCPNHNPPVRSPVPTSHASNRSRLTPNELQNQSRQHKR